jgi:hypothetical protein
MKDAMQGGANTPGADQAVNEALQTIGLLFEPGDVIEIRALNVGRTDDRPGLTFAGYFNFENDQAIKAAIRKVNGKAEGVYVVLNSFNRVLLARAKNRLQGGLKNTTSDKDITRRRWLYVDADAIRPAGISATEEEHQAALQRTSQIREFLRDIGWPEPILADSGNGGHLLYLLPPLDLVRAGELVKACLKALAIRFSDATVAVDQATATTARICKLYGTLARKGDSTPDRPHRRSRVVDEPERIEPVPIEALESLAKGVESVEPPAATSVSALSAGQVNIEEWLASSGREVIKGPEPYHGGRRWTLRTCPFNPEHRKPVVIQFPSGALCYKCQHKSCAQNGWKALREMVKPGYRHTNGAPPAPAEVAAPISPLISDLAQIPSVWNLDAKIEWCVEDMIARGSVTLICAESGTGKTWLAYHIAGCVARSASVLGRAVKRSKVLYLDGENPLYVVKQRLFDLGIAETPDLTIWGGWFSPPPSPSNPLVIKFAREHKGLIIYDSLIEFHPGSEQSSTETRAFMRQFRALANLGATVVVLHHAGKAETAKLYRGSSDIKAAVDTAYLLRRPEEGAEKLGTLSMNCFKGRLAPGQNFAMEFRDKAGFVPCEPSEPVRTIREIISEILEANPASNQKQVVTMARQQGCTKRQAEECLKNGSWERAEGPKNSILYSLPLEDIL